MAVLEKIRVKFGLAISIIIALALLSFIIDPSTLESALQGMSSKYDVGKIAGRAIRYTDYAEDVQRFTDINEVISGSTAHNEQELKQIRDAAWQSLVDKYMFIKNAQDAGITVGKAEMLDLTTGNNPSPVILQSFSGAQGFDSQAVVDFVQNTVPQDQTGRLQTYWNYLQTTVNSQQYYTKYGNLFTASAYQNALEKAESIARNNTTANVDYVAVNYPFMQDSTIVVSPAEIKAYYKAHPDFYEQRANRDIEYVVFEVTPSEDDIAYANQKISEVYDQFATADNMKSFLLKNSERQLSDYWYKAGELNTINAEINDFVFGGNGNGTSPVIKDKNNVFYAVRVLDTAPVSDSVYVRHILLSSDKKSVADSLVGVIKKGGNFAALAAQFSSDQGSQADGELGNIGWMTQTYMIPGFESVISAKVGEPYVIDTQYGTHVVMVSKKTAPVLKKKVAILEKSAISSKETFNDYYSQANRFATLANHSYEGYKKAVDSLGVYSHVMNINEGTSSYGAIDQAKEVTRWAFDAKEGKASDIITVNNNYFFVATVKKAYAEGVASLEEVTPSIRQRLYASKLAEAKKAEIAEKIAGKTSLEEIASILGTTVTNEPAMALANTVRALDPALVGAASVAPEGQVYGPVAGDIATYVLKVNSRETGSFFTEEDAAAQALQKAQYTTQMIIPVMTRIADVKDHRDRFY